jgi:hypothetical protein
LAREASFYVIAFSYTLHGEEVPLSDLTGILKHWPTSCNSDPPHIEIVLLGHFNGELGENYHLLPIVTITCSGIDNKKWIGWLLDFYKNRSISNGPVFHNSQGTRINALDYESMFFDWLEQVQVN